MSGIVSLHPAAVSVLTSAVAGCLLANKFALRQDGELLAAGPDTTTLFAGGWPQEKGLVTGADPVPMTELVTPAAGSLEARGGSQPGDLRASHPVGSRLMFVFWGEFGELWAGAGVAHATVRAGMHPAPGSPRFRSSAVVISAIEITSHNASASRW